MDPKNENEEAPPITLDDVSAADDATEAEKDDHQLVWLKTVYQGDTVPQLTVRAVIMGGLLGSIMSISNLYTTLKLGWAFGVAITACVLSFVIWNSLRKLLPVLTPMSILENNCMQSTASAAGYSTGATIGTAFGAYLLITGEHVPWNILLPFTLVTALLGVFLAVPMKRQMINHEQLPFPSGIAAAETLRSLYAKSRDAVYQAYALVGALVTGACIGVFSKGDYAWQKATHLKIPEFLPFTFSWSGINMSRMQTFGFEPSSLLIGAGMIVGMRVSASMLLGAAILFFGFAPWVVANNIEVPEKILKWSLWTGTALMVTSGLTAFAVQWKTIVRSFTVAKGAPAQAELDRIEVPTRWFVIGVIPLTIAMSILLYVAFSIAPWLGLISVIMSFFLALVACRATGETDITPIGAMGKLTQICYAALAPSNITANLMTASVTANTAIASADLLTDLKSGYLLGANARKQFLAQFIGVFFGTVAIVPAWFLMVPNKAALEAFNPPSTNMWKAVAEALTKGIDQIPETARLGLVIGGLLGIVLALIEHFFPKAKKFLPSAMGLGLSWVVPFTSCLSFFIGALLALIWVKTDKRRAELFTVPVASGAIAGESLASAAIAIINAAVAIPH